jgi:hypothetical protein
MKYNLYILFLLFCWLCQSVKADIGGGVAGSLTVRNSILYNDLNFSQVSSGVSVLNSALRGTAVGTNSQIFSNTGYEDAIVSPTDTLSYYLAVTSSLRNRGNNTVPAYMPATDINGNPRVYNDTIDMGAVEYSLISRGTTIYWDLATLWNIGRIPASNDIVTIQTPATVRDTVSVCRSVIGISNGPLTINTNSRLVVGESITNTNAANLIVKSAANQFNGTLIYYNPESKPVSGTVEMYSKASWDLSKTSDNDKYKWQFFGIPLRTLVANPAFTGAYVRKMLESGTSISNHWELLTNSSVLESFTGYEICQEAPKTYYFSGQLENRDKTVGNPFAVTVSTALYPGQHLLANPYTAAIDVQKIEFGSNMIKTVYLYNTGTFNQWNSNTAAQTGELPGQYVSIPQNQAGTPGIPRRVPSMSSMLVRVNTAATNYNTNTYVKFDYSEVVSRNTAVQRTAAIDKNTNDIPLTDPLLMITVLGENTIDRTWLFANDRCSEEFDNGYDGLKMQGVATQSMIYTQTRDGQYQVNTTNDINNSIIGFKAGTDSEYTLRFNSFGLNASYSSLYLFDKVENTLVDISAEFTEYLFRAENTALPVNRFLILAKPIDKTSDEVNNVLIYAENSKICVKNISGKKAQIVVSDLTGKNIYNARISEEELIAIPARPYTPYIVTSLTDDGRSTNKIVLK